ncbi:MAG: carboxypeptidase-like regulatory domain-containing protein [Gemmatimonadota bacterium]|jgi:hypothetical protein
MKRGTHRNGTAVRSWVEPVALAFLILAGCASSLHAQTVDGTLLERGTDVPVGLALVTLLTQEGDTLYSVLSDSTGHFRLKAPHEGKFRLAAGAPGYKSTVTANLISLHDGISTFLKFRIDPRPIEIAGLTIEARAVKVAEGRLVRNGFVKRARQGLGRFFTPHDIETYRGSRRTSALLAETGRIVTLYSLDGNRLAMFGSRGYCHPTVYVDGHPVNLSDAPIDAIVPLADLAAVEVYRSAAEAPFRFGGGFGGCGVIVLWTKTGSLG